MMIDYRVVQKKTGCTGEQAKYLAAKINELPKLQKQIMKHLDEVNLCNCAEVDLVRLYDHYDTSCNIIGYIRKGYITIMYKFGFDTLLKDDIFKDVIDVV